MSKRFHELVTTPHAWRIAFSRYFPGPEVLNTLDSTSENSTEEDALRVDHRLFARLTALASWRSEYIQRTRLLRALGKGKPADFVDATRAGSSRSNLSAIPVAQVTYNSNLMAPVTHIHANFGATLNNKSLKFIHGADENAAASTSDPQWGKIDSWGSLDVFQPHQFADTFPGDPMYGLGAGDVVGVPNMMDVSQVYGMIYGEGLSAGLLRYRSVEEKRGRTLMWTVGADDADNGVPALMDGHSVCSVWIAKSSKVPDLSEGLVGILSGSSTGVLTAYSIGNSGVRDRRIERGEIIARWVLSPGVPLIAIVVDEDLSSQRLLDNRIWIVVLNALGEIFFLDDMLKQSEEANSPPPSRDSHTMKLWQENLAWANGRSVHWKLLEASRRLARPNPFQQSAIDGSYSPRSSWNKMYLNPKQLAAETKEIIDFMHKKPKDFQKLCDGWDMQRRLEVDFASSDECNAGETICVVSCGLQEGQEALIKRFTHCRFREESSTFLQKLSDESSPASDNQVSSIFGGSPFISHSGASIDSSGVQERNDAFRRRSFDLTEEWRISRFEFGGLKTPQFTTTAIDQSTCSRILASEDPLLLPSLSSASSSPTSSPLDKMATGGSIGNIPGQRARFLAAGTKNGTVFLWNIRAPVSSNTFLENSVKPIRIIYTDSPQISCLALTALYLVHGGNDGLVQAWDPLASTTEPIRTLNSRFSSRARRRLIQAEASPAGVGINLFAAGAICLDSDPTMLRGMVSLGAHLRYWSYDSLTIESYRNKKRRARRSERGSNQGAERYSGTGRGALMEYIANEKLELEREKRNKRKEEERLAGRFGVDLLGPGASEDEIMAYATMLSEEAAQVDELRRKSSSERSSSSDTIIEEAISPPVSSIQQDEFMDREEEDVTEAIRMSLQGSSPSASPPSASSDIPIKFAKKKRLPIRSPSNPNSSVPSRSELAPHRHSGSPPGSTESDELEFALRLSLAEEQSRTASKETTQPGGKGKEREL